MSDTKFTRMQDATRDDYKVIGRHSLEFFAGLPDRILSHLQLLDEDTGILEIKRAVRYGDEMNLPRVKLGAGIVGYAALTCVLPR